MKPIKPVNNHGSIQLRFSVSGKRYSFNPIPGGQYRSPEDLNRAKAIANQIRLDILAGHFDSTLNRYRVVPKVPLGSQWGTLALWDAWVKTLELPAATKSDHYEMVWRMLVKGEPRLKDVSWLVEAKLAPSTFNKRLGMIRRCFQWAVGRDLVDENPYGAIKSRKQIKKPVKPFTREEAKAILESFRSIAPHYTPFVLFLFLTGCRLSEAIGLRWEDVDFDRGEIDISSSLVKDRTGNGYKRIRKGTKTENMRLLDLNDELRLLLEDIGPRGPDLIFTSPKGNVIDSGNFHRSWKKALEAANVPYRKIHAIRHTLLSMALEEGLPVTSVAYLAGHADSRMILQTYGHIINRPKLPRLDLGT